VVKLLVAALEPDDVVLGGGNVKQLKELPPGTRAGDNANAFSGGFRLWQPQKAVKTVAARSKKPAKKKLAKGKQI
jgi:polyphosphate glucokinase